MKRTELKRKPAKHKQRICIEKAEGCEGKYWPRHGQMWRCCNNINCLTQKIRKEQAKKQARERADLARERRETKERHRTFNGWCKHERDYSMNPYIRVRDRGKPCISCGRPWNDQFQAGHFMSVGSRPELQFHPANNNGQCRGCNANVRGNTKNVAARYHAGMVERWGAEITSYLETYHAVMDYGIDEVREIGAHYRELKRLLPTP